jgi:hypothetical protein
MPAFVLRTRMRAPAAVRREQAPPERTGVCGREH